jgi:hypothetical protein
MVSAELSGGLFKTAQVASAQDWLSYRFTEGR